MSTVDRAFDPAAEPPTVSECARLVRRVCVLLAAWAILAVVFVPPHGRAEAPADEVDDAAGSGPPEGHAQRAPASNGPAEADALPVLAPEAPADASETTRANIEQLARSMTGIDLERESVGRPGAPMRLQPWMCRGGLGLKFVIHFGG